MSLGDPVDEWLFITIDALERRFGWPHAMVDSGSTLAFMDDLSLLL
jgi:hypothetical protein